MQAEPEFQALNAEFIDLVIQRWELLMEARLAPEDPGEDGEESPQQQILAMVGYADQRIAEVRRQAAAMERALPFDLLVDSYGLSPIEAEIVQIAVVPQLDLSFRKLIARYHNNILYDFVDVDLVLNLLFPSRRERLHARRLFAADAPLITHRLLMLAPAKEPKGSGLLAQELRPPDRLADYLLGRRTLDASLRRFADLIDPQVPFDSVMLPEEDRQDIVALVRHMTAQEQGRSRRFPGVPGPYPVGGGVTVAIVGPSGHGKTMLSHAIATMLGRPVLEVDSGRLNAAGDGMLVLLDQLFTEARVQGAVLVFDRAEPVLSKTNTRVPALLSQLDRFGGLAILTFAKPDELDAGVERHVAWQLIMGLPEPEQRHEIWRQHLEGSGLSMDETVDMEDLGTRFEVTGGQIKNACQVAIKRSAVVPGSDGGTAAVSQALLKAAAYGQLRANMEDYTVRSKIHLTLEDLVLPEEAKTLIHEVLDACRNRVYVMSKWGFGRRLVTGKGICVLFKGEPGTGKTLCAEILAAELGMKLFQISIPKIVSKYIGETEKNIAKIFSTARANHSMLLFDEADSLFTKRVSVENAVDRFSNMEVNLLLQEIERFEGITILTTNLDKNIDDAFARRIQYKIEFPFPEPDHRSLIWKAHFPKEAPISGEIDFDDLGDAFELSGGNIKNAVIRAAYRAAARGEGISYDDIEFAAEQECKNAGKLFRVSRGDDEW